MQEEKNEGEGLWKKKNIMVKKDKTRHKSDRAKEIGSKAVPSISCRAVVALTVGCAMVL